MSNGATAQTNANSSTVMVRASPLWIFVRKSAAASRVMAERFIAMSGNFGSVSECSITRKANPVRSLGSLRNEGLETTRAETFHGKHVIHWVCLGVAACEGIFHRLVMKS